MATDLISLYQSVALLRRYQAMTDEQMDEQQHAELDWLEEHLS
jgi:hypothetical protein